MQLHSVARLCMWWLFNILRRFVTLFAQDELDVDLRTLRAIRVLRPLKLVSGIPSKFSRNTINSYQRCDILKIAPVKTKRYKYW